MITKTSPSRFVATAVMATTVMLSSAPVLARGGAPSIMDSPGYQRRLQESRQQLPEAAAQPSPSHRKKQRHP